jgi:hypothetical protein
MDQDEIPNAEISPSFKHSQPRWNFPDRLHQSADSGRGVARKRKGGIPCKFFDHKIRKNWILHSQCWVFSKDVDLFQKKKKTNRKISRNPMPNYVSANHIESINNIVKKAPPWRGQPRGEKKYVIARLFKSPSRLQRYRSIMFEKVAQVP